MKNTDLGPAALRSRSQTARSLARAGVFMGEHLNVITRAGGSIAGARRAVAFTSSRVREGEGAETGVAEFHAWARQVDDELNATLRNIHASGEGFIAGIVSKLVQSRLKPYEGKKFPLVTFSLGDVTLHDLSIDVKNDVQVSARFGSGAG